MDNRISVTDATVSNIHNLITSKGYLPGEKLPTEATLCKMFNVSRTSVREAIRVLQAWGYVEIKPGRGSFVSDKALINTDDLDSVSSFDSIISVRESLELLSIRLSVQQATQEQIEELELIHNEFILANLSGNWFEMGLIDERFHKKIVEFTNNQILIAFLNQLFEMYRKYRIQLVNTTVYKKAIDQHSRILKYYYTRDTENAAKEMANHLKHAAEDIMDIRNNNSL